MKRPKPTADCWVLNMFRGFSLFRSSSTNWFFYSLCSVKPLETLFLYIFTVYSIVHSISAHSEKLALPGFITKVTSGNETFFPWYQIYRSGPHELQLFILNCFIQYKLFWYLVYWVIFSGSKVWILWLKLIKCDYFLYLWVVKNQTTNTFIRTVTDRFS